VDDLPAAEPQPAQSSSTTSGRQTRRQCNVLFLSFDHASAFMGVGRLRRPASPSIVIIATAARFHVSNKHRLLEAFLHFIFLLFQE
jgi:hypothetical protein